jgi:hypothetical protein
MCCRQEKGSPLKNSGASIKAVLAGAATGTALGLLGFWLAEVPSTHAMGMATFILTPFAAGFAIAMVTQDQSNKVFAATALALLTSLTLLISAGLETILCAVTAFPLLLGALLTGALLGFLFRRLIAKFTGGTKFTSVVLLSLPLMIFTAHRIEMPTLLHSRQEMVTTSIRLSGAPNIIWANLQSFDSLQVDKSFLMYVGLPIPERCTMEGTGLGATRTCYFNKGYIKETVIEWQPPFVMGLSIDRTNLPGRHWLGFENARYELRPDGNQTVLTRATTIRSYLYPVWYWKPFETWGVSSEHRYIFADLARRLGQGTVR